MASPKLVSITEDDEHLRTALVGLVRSLGYAASGHASADAFLAAGEAERSDCIVTDIQMPGTNGLELKKRLDALGINAPVIMITALSETTVLAKARASGAFCLLRKPFRPDDLIACLERALAPCV